MAATIRPLARALHTVTSCARVAVYLRATSPGDGRDAEDLAMAALDVLGYGRASVAASPALRDACIAAVARALEARA